MKPATILIIEDHASVRRLLAQVLTEAGYEVSEATTGRLTYSGCIRYGGAVGGPAAFLFRHMSHDGRERTYG